MTNASIFHLEPFDRFTHRVVQLNALYNPEDPLHAALTGNGTGDNGAVPADAVAAARKRLAALHREFPAGAPVADQAAYLIRGFVGLAVFDEANHRTGWDYTAELLRHQHHEVVAPDAEARSLGAETWQRLQASHPDGLRRRDLSQRDDTFEMLRHWFHRRIS